MQTFWNETWAPISFGTSDGAPRYEVSNYGRLRSFRGPNAEGLLIKGSVIQGYRSLNIRFDGRTLNRYVHKLVAEQFVKRDTADQIYVVHLDFDKQNNYYQNLRWLTKDEMIEHNRNNPALKNRSLTRPTRNYKLTEPKVKMIKKLLLNENNRLKTIARQFGITHTQLNRIRTGENWKHVTIDT